MVTFLIILVLVSAFAALVTGVLALRAGLRLRRTQAALRTNLYSEIDQLVRRSTELEESLASLDARAQDLPVRVLELQQNLATLRILTNALGASLRQSRRVLSFTGPAPSRDDESESPVRHKHEEGSPAP